ncbi:MAG: hypothetical protein ACFFHV_20315 [Promethearchaeota archaeon]
MNLNILNIEKKDLFLHAIGISNLCLDPESHKLYSVQFYDYDKNGENTLKEDILEIKEIFPYDCIMYETKHGIHFISFALLKGSYTTKARALQLTKNLEQQDYWCKLKDLTLRVSPKWVVSKIRKKYKIVSERPRFKGVVKEPNKYRISKGHLEYYKANMNLPLSVYESYLDCEMFDYRLKLTNYKTRD